MMVNYEIKFFYGGITMDIGAILIIVGALLTLPLMYIVRYLVIEKKTNKS